jgi:predicted transcriptional regulator
MEVHLPPDLQNQLQRIAAERGRNAESLVFEAVERFVGHERWFVREVEKGLAAADRGEFIEHSEVGRLIDSRYPG